MVSSKFFICIEVSLSLQHRQESQIPYADAFFQLFISFLFLLLLLLHWPFFPSFLLFHLLFLPPFLILAFLPQPLLSISRFHMHTNPSHSLFLFKNTVPNKPGTSYVDQANSNLVVILLSLSYNCWDCKTVKIFRNICFV